MAHIVIASDTPLCQKAKNWLIKNKNCIDDLSQIDTLNGYRLYIVANDEELGDGSTLIDLLSKHTFPEDFITVLIICSTTNKTLKKNQVVSAIKIAKHFHLSVLLAKTVVYKVWNDEFGTSMTSVFYCTHGNLDPDTPVENLESY